MFHDSYPQIDYSFILILLRLHMELRTTAGALRIPLLYIVIILSHT
jgi:hypothetical protein